nr:hypothetical protein [uncultured Methylophaga sp.]
MNKAIKLDSSVNWQRLEAHKSFEFFILNINEDSKSIEFLVRLKKGEALFQRSFISHHTQILKGKHCTHYNDGAIKEVEETGSYKISLPSDVPEAVSSGVGETVVLYRFGKVVGPLYQVFDEQYNVIETFDLVRFQELHKAQLV